MMIDTPPYQDLQQALVQLEQAWLKDQKRLCTKDRNGNLIEPKPGKGYVNIGLGIALGVSLGVYAFMSNREILLIAAAILFGFFTVLGRGQNRQADMYVLKKELYELKKKKLGILMEKF